MCYIAIMKQKYPRTSHVLYSEKLSEDDIIHNYDIFENKNVVVTIKMDGENTTIYNDDSHARSLNSDKDSEDRRWIELFRMLKVYNKIPSTYRICGENLFYKHTVKYDNLKSYFNLFSIWDGDICLSWEDTLKLANKLNIETVPVLYTGIYDKELILKKFNEYKKNINAEGFVIRLLDSFHLNDFSTSISKFVSNDFVIPSEHWKYSVKERNHIIYEDYWNIA